MTHLTYTIAHIRVGAEKPYVEIHGYISNTGRQLLTAEAFVNIMNGNSFTTGYEPRNVDHFLSPLAEKLGAKIYGGFYDEKNFYVVIPTYGKFRVGDIFKFEDFDTEIFAHSGISFFLKKKSRYKTAQRKFLESFHEDDMEFIKYNLFQDYAKTGVVENELYKQFFK